MSVKVSVVKCLDYLPSNLEKSIKQSLELISDNSSLIPKNSKILLKPNLLSSTKGPDKLANTHTEFMRALAELLKREYNSDVYIGDSSGGASYGKTNDAFEVSGLSRLAKELSINLVNFDNTGAVTLTNEKNKIQKSFQVTNFLQEVDFIISVPKLKTHTLLGFTGAVKNMMGVVPGSGKRDMHFIAPRPLQMSYCIVDLFSLVKPHLNIMDAIWGMEGDGPAAGNPRNVGLILASRDAVALDTVALEISGFKSKEVDLIKDASSRGLGIGDLSEIDVVGDRIEDIKVNDFKKPQSWIREFVLDYCPEFILKRGFLGMTSGEPVIDVKLCQKCGMCIQGCPVDAIDTLEDGNLKVRKKDCIECFCCHELCPHNAVKIKLPLMIILLKFTFRTLKKILNLFRKNK